MLFVNTFFIFLSIFLCLRKISQINRHKNVLSCFRQHILIYNKFSSSVIFTCSLHSSELLLRMDCFLLLQNLRHSLHQSCINPYSGQPAVQIHVPHGAGIIDGHSIRFASAAAATAAACISITERSIVHTGRSTLIDTDMLCASPSSTAVAVTIAITVTIHINPFLSRDHLSLVQTMCSFFFDHGQLTIKADKKTY